MLRKHWGALVLALVIMASMSLPQLIAEHRMGATYAGVHPVITDDELYYLARAHETLDGHPTLGSPLLAEHKNDPAVQMWIPDYVLAKTEIFLLGSLKSGFLLWDIVLPFVGALVMYATVYLLTGEIAVSLAVVATLYLGVFFVSLNRTPFPQLIFLLFGSFYCVLRAIRSAKWGWWVAAALLGASLFYSYPYFWTYWVALMGFGIFTLFVGARKEGQWKPLSLSLVGAAILALPYLIEQYATSILPGYADELRRDAVIPTHFPSGIIAVVVALFTLAVLAFCYWKRLIPRTSQTLLLAAGALAGIAVMNQQIITGVEPQSSEHYTITVVSMCVFALAVCALPILRRILAAMNMENWERTILWSLAALCIALSVLSVYPSILRAATPQPKDIAAQRYGPILSWLDAHTNTDAVVYADQTLSPYIPAYTHDDVFFAYEVFQTYISQSELDARFAGAHYLDPSFTRQDLFLLDQSVLGSYYVALYQHAAQENIVRKLLGIPPVIVERYPSAVFDPLLAQVTAVRAGSFEAALDGFKVNYLVWDTVLDPDWRMNLVPDLTQVYSANGIIVYALPNATSTSQ